MTAADSHKGLLHGKLVLNETITIPPHKASIYIQNGQVFTSAGYTTVDQYYANCKFELREIETKPREITPDSFTIKRVIFEENLSAQPASLRYALNLSSRMHISSGGLSYVDYATVMMLHSDKQPHVFRLSCQHWEDPNLAADHLSIEQIQQTLGKLFTLIPAKLVESE